MVEWSNLNNKQILGRTKTFKHKTKDIWVSVWMDNREVRIGSTFAYHQGYCERVVKKGGYSLQRVPQPSNVASYNLTMGAVDLRDQFGSYVEITVRCKRPMRPYFLNNLLMSAVCNTRVVENHLRACKRKAVNGRSVVQIPTLGLVWVQHDWLGLLGLVGVLGSLGWLGSSLGRLGLYPKTSSS